MVLTGRFGPFVHLGEQVDGSKEKPQRASLFAPARERAEVRGLADDLLAGDARGAG